MGESGGASPSGQGVDRRRFLLRTLGAGSVALAVPTIVTVTPAGAITSPPPQPQTEVEPSVQPRPAGDTAGPQVAASERQLPFTGADVEKLVVGGSAAVVGGAGLICWSTLAHPTPTGPATSPTMTPDE